MATISAVDFGTILVHSTMGSKVFAQSWSPQLSPSPALSWLVWLQPRLPIHGNLSQRQ